MRAWVGALGAFVSGIGLGYLYTEISVEARVRKEYEESAEMRRRAFDLAEQYRNPAEAPEVDPEEEVRVIDQLEVTSISLDVGPNAFGGKIDYKPLEENPYHTPPQVLDETGEQVELVPIMYITEEDYIEADGRAKEQLTFVGDGNVVHFFEEGVEIEDWKDRLGESFLVDFQKLVPYGADLVVWVRNQKTDTDYEVIREIP